jgi:hypothetical protein
MLKRTARRWASTSAGRRRSPSTLPLIDWPKVTFLVNKTEGNSCMDTTTASIARVCHEANRAWCEVNGDGTQVPFDEAPNWQVDSALEGVQKALDGATPRELHQSWCAAKVRDGWHWGEVKDPEAKTHPCLVDYDELPEEQRRKDALFAAIVKALA